MRAQLNDTHEYTLREGRSRRGAFSQTNAYMMSVKYTKPTDRTGGVNKSSPEHRERDSRAATCVIHGTQSHWSGFHSLLCVAQAFWLNRFISCSCCLSGHFGQVREVCERATGILWAGKFLKLQRGAGSRLGLERAIVEREVEILQSLQHQNIMALKDVFESKAEVVLIVEL